MEPTFRYKQNAARPIAGEGGGGGGGGGGVAHNMIH